MKKINFATPIFTLVTLTVIILGWLERDEYWYTAENGLGYSFGIIGASMMLLLLLYPARKYWKPMRRLFKVHHWFRFHMIFGVWGPVLILLHCNFSLGSVNSNVALCSMLLVAGSGLIGRFVYQKLHRGLYGEQIQFSDLDSAYQRSKNNIINSPSFDESLAENFSIIESELFQRKVPILTSIQAGFRINKLKQKVKKTVKDSQQLTVEASDINNIISSLNSLKKLASHALYTRLFSLWHVFHLPIFFMMIITAIVHIFVVHMY